MDKWMDNSRDPAEVVRALSHSPGLSLVVPTGFEPVSPP
jgi:hypothetical protein